MYTKSQHASRLVARLLIVLILLCLGFVFLFLPTDPGYSSNIVAWLETEGSYLAHTLGVFFLVFGIAGFLYLTKAGREKNLVIKKGPLICCVDRTLFEQTVQKLWEDYFPGYECLASLRKRKLHITGKVPDDFDDGEKLSAHIAERLLVLTGYWGDISLTLIGNEESPNERA